MDIIKKSPLNHLKSHLHKILLQLDIQIVVLEQYELADNNSI